MKSRERCVLTALVKENPNRGRITLSKLSGVSEKRCRRFLDEYKNHDSVVGVLSDSHIPFMHPRYAEFIENTFDDWKVNRVVHCGDLVDNHAISYHEHDPDGHSASEELDKAKKIIQKEIAIRFPYMTWVLGNHDRLIQRKAFSAGLPKEAIKSPEETWGIPKDWVTVEDIEIDNVLYEHGLGGAGMNGARNLALKNRQSVVIGHSHSYANIQYMASNHNIIFGMNVGCGIDKEAYTFSYGKTFPIKPVLACGVVINGRIGHVIPMPFNGIKNYRRIRN